MLKSNTIKSYQNTNPVIKSRDNDFGTVVRIILNAIDFLLVNVNY